MFHHTNRISGWLDHDDYELPVPTLRPAETLDEILLLAPEVGSILQQARSVRKPTWKHYSAFKRRLMLYVGWTASDDRLATSTAYDLALRAMVDELGI